MDLSERLYHARHEIMKQTQSYIDALIQIEMYKIPKYLYDPFNNTLTRVEELPTLYEIWLKDRIEEIRTRVLKQFNIEV